MRAGRADGGGAWFLVRAGSSGAGGPLFHLHNAPAARNAQPDGADVRIALAIGFEQDIHRCRSTAVGFREHAPTVHVELQLAVALGQADAAGGGVDLQVCGGAVLGVGDFPTLIPASGGIDGDAAPALDGFGARVVQGGGEIFCGLAHAPALDQGLETRGRQRRQDGDDGYHHHQLDGGESGVVCRPLLRGCAEGWAWKCEEWHRNMLWAQGGKGARAGMNGALAQTSGQ